MAALKALKPPENMTVSQWADKFRVLSPKDSAAPGRWHTNRTPYLKAPMDAFCNIHVKEITAVMGTQSGKTQMELNMMGYAVDQNPGPMMIVYPTDKLAETVSQNRLKPMLQMSEPLRKSTLSETARSWSFSSGTCILPWWGQIHLPACHPDRCNMFSLTKSTSSPSGPVRKPAQ